MYKLKGYDDEELKGTFYDQKLQKVIKQDDVYVKTFQIFPIQMDVCDPEAIKNAVDVCVERLGLPHIVIDSAAGSFIYQQKGCLQIPGKQLWT